MRIQIHHLRVGCNIFYPQLLSRLPADAAPGEETDVQGIAQEDGEASESEMNFNVAAH